MDRADRRFINSAARLKHAALLETRAPRLSLKKMYEAAVAPSYRSYFSVCSSGFLELRICITLAIDTDLRSDFVRRRACGVQS